MTSLRMYSISSALGFNVAVGMVSYRLVILVSATDIGRWILMPTSITALCLICTILLSIINLHAYLMNINSNPLLTCASYVLVTKLLLRDLICHTFLKPFDCWWPFSGETSLFGHSTCTCLIQQVSLRKRLWNVHRTRLCCIKLTCSHTKCLLHSQKHEQNRDFFPVLGRV